MTDVLAAEINRTGLQSLEAPDSFETDASFEIRLRNHGEATHVHLHLDDDLSAVARLEAGNHYVQTESERPVRVQVRDPGQFDGPVRGKLKIVTGYGATTHYVNVTVGSTGTDEQPVEVDPELSRPQRSAVESGSPLWEDADVGAVPALALGVVALVLAIGAATAGGTTAIVLAVLAIVAGLLGAGYLLVR